MGVRDDAQRVVRNSWREVQAEDITFMAGSIAYHAFVSMLPLLVFLLVVLSAVGNEAFTAELAGVTEQFLTPYARDLLVESLDVTSARTGVSLVGAVTLLWGMSKIFRSLDVAFSKIYDSQREKTLLGKVENAVVVFFGLGVAVLAFLAASAVYALFPTLPYPAVLNPLLLVVGLAIAFLPIYYVFPDVDVTLREVVPGVVVAALGWTVLESAFQAYVAYAGRYEAVYGTLGSAFLLLIWLYFSGLILLVGGVVNAVLAGRTGDRNALDDPVIETTGDDGHGQSRHRRTPAVGTEPEADGGTGADDRPDADTQVLERRVQRLAAENERLKRENANLTRKLTRRRGSILLRAKRWLFGE